MVRIELITDGTDLVPEARAVADRIVETRGEVTRPFQILLHSPSVAGPVAELGDVVRSASTLTDPDRELATLATGSVVGCDFVWTSHLASAAAAGIPAETIAKLRGDRTSLGARETAIVAFVDELCATNSVSPATFDRTRDILGVRGIVELALTVGYYTMLARVMGTFEAC